MRKILPAIIIACTFPACDAITGKEVARLELNRISNKELVIKETRLNLRKGEDVAFWTEVDMEFENDLALAYFIEVWKDSTLQGSFQLDALETNPTLMEMKTTFNGKTSWSYTGKMDFLRIEDDGDYAIKAIIKSSDNPTLLLHKADLILKK